MLWSPDLLSAVPGLMPLCPHEQSKRILQEKRAENGGVWGICKNQKLAKISQYKVRVLCAPIPCHPPHPSRFVVSVEVFSSLLRAREVDLNCVASFFSVLLGADICTHVSVFLHWPKVVLWLPESAWSLISFQNFHRSWGSQRIPGVFVWWGTPLAPGEGPRESFSIATLVLLPEDLASGHEDCEELKRLLPREPHVQRHGSVKQ